MLLSAVSVLVVAQSSSEIPEGLMNNPVYIKFEDDLKNMAAKLSFTDFITGLGTVYYVNRAYRYTASYNSYRLHSFFLT